MHIHSHNTLFASVAALQSTSSSTTHSIPPTPQAKDQEASSKNAENTGPVNDSVQLSNQDPELAKLKARDREVRAHEAAHASAAGSLAKGGPSYTYQRGSDGRLYAVGGEVSIDTSAVAGDPEATIQKARQIRAAANAPANPSAQDRAVAAQASRMEAQARRELQQERTEDIQNATSPTENPSPLESKTIDLFA